MNRDEAVWRELREAMGKPKLTHHLVIMDVAGGLDESMWDCRSGAGRFPVLSWPLRSGQSSPSRSEGRCRLVPEPTRHPVCTTAAGCGPLVLAVHSKGLLASATPGASMTAAGTGRRSGEKAVVTRPR